MTLIFLLIIACACGVKTKLWDDLRDDQHHSQNILVEASSDSKYENVEKKYKPEWQDLDTRPLPKWYDQAKIGIMMHWGVYSVPSFYKSSEWFWPEMGTKEVRKFMDKNYPPGFRYQEFAPMFTAELFDPGSWAKLFSKAGAKYVVLTSKHHDGYTLFPSKYSFGWNSVDVGPHRDLVGDLAKAVRNESLEFGVYYSLYEWYNPLYCEDSRNGHRTNIYTRNKLTPEFLQLVNDYKPSIIWSDGDWEAHDAYWNSTNLLAWLYNDSPVKDHVVVNDRWGIGIPCHHGDFYNCRDRYNPGVLQNHKWEGAFSLHRGSWGYRRDTRISDILTSEELITSVVKIISCGGNALINIGPTKEGTIIPLFQERLLDLGKWLEANGESIYGTKPWLHQNDTSNNNVWYTCIKAEYSAHRLSKKESYIVTAIYTIFLEWPEQNVLTVKDLNEVLKNGKHKIELLTTKTKLNWKITNGHVKINLPERNTVHSKYAWVLKITRA